MRKHNNKVVYFSISEPVWLLNRVDFVTFEQNQTISF